LWADLLLPILVGVTYSFLPVQVFDLVSTFMNTTQTCDANMGDMGMGGMGMGGMGMGGMGGMGGECAMHNPHSESFDYVLVAVQVCLAFTMVLCLSFNAILLCHTLLLSFDTILLCHTLYMSFNAVFYYRLP
jgi:hypothetical protein